MVLRWSSLSTSTVCITYVLTDCGREMSVARPRAVRGRWLHSHKHGGAQIWPRELQGLRIAWKVRQSARATRLYRMALWVRVTSHSGRMFMYLCRRKRCVTSIYPPTDHTTDWYRLLEL